MERLTTHCGVEYSSLGRPHSKKTSTKWKNSKNKKKLEAASSAHSWNAGWRQAKLESEAQFCSQVKVVQHVTAGRLTPQPPPPPPFLSARVWWRILRYESALITLCQFMPSVHSSSAFREYRQNCLESQHRAAPKYETRTFLFYGGESISTHG